MENNMGKTLFVNISDIHIKESNKNDIIHKLDRLSAQLKAIKNLVAMEKSSF